MSAVNTFYRDSDSFNMIFDLAPLPMWVFDLESYKFLAVNKEATRHYGYTEDEFLKMTIKDIRPSEDVPQLEAAIKIARKRKEIYKESLYRHKKKDGSVIHVQIKSNLIDFEGKKAEIVTAVDLTERYQQEEDIEEKSQFLITIGVLHEILLKSDDWSKALVQCFQIVGEFLDVHQIYFYQNDFLKHTTSQRLEWTRNSQEVPVDNPDFQNIPFSEFPLFMDYLQRGEPFEAVVSELPSSLAKKLLEEQHVQTILVLPVMINYDFSGFIRMDDCKSQRKWRENEFQLLRSLTSNLGHVIKESQAHQKLVDNEARFRSLVQNGSDLIAIIDLEGNYKYVAPTSTKVLGIRPQEFMGKNVFEFIYKEDVARLKRSLEQVISQDRVSIEPYRFRDVYENWRWIQTDLTNHLFDPAIGGIVANTREVTAEVEKRLGEQLLASLTRIISQPGSLASCLEKALKKLIKLSNIDIGEVWLISEDKSRLDLIAKSYIDKRFAAGYQNFPLVDNFEKGKGFPGYIWQMQGTCVWENLKENTYFLRSNLVALADINTAIGIPFRYNEEFLGCLICFSSSKKNELSEQLKLLSEIGLQMGAVLKQKMTEEQHQNFFNISPDPHCLLGFDGYLKKINVALENLLGYDRDELMNRHLFHFIHKDDEPEAQERFNNVVKGKPSISFEARLLTKSGQVKWLVWRGAAIPESKIIIAAAKDITEQKVAELELSYVNERLKTAQKIAKLGYWVREFDKDVTEWSEEAYAIHGYTPENFTPTMENVINTFHIDDKNLIESDPLESLEPGKVQSFEHRILTATNEVKWVRQEIRLVTDDEHKPIRLEGTIQDITERKEYELQLAISNERFQLAIKASNEMIWEVDHQTQEINRSKGYDKSINYQTSESFSKESSWFRKMHPKDLEKVWPSIQNALQNKEETFWSMEYKMIKEDGSEAYFVDRCFILRDKKGRPMRSVGSVLDVTASRQQLERIKQQNKHLKEIAWIQSHVIRAPLSRIMSLIYLVKEHDGGGKTLEEIFDMISVSAEELDKVIFEIIHKTEAVKGDDPTNLIN